MGLSQLMKETKSANIQDNIQQLTCLYDGNNQLNVVDDLPKFCVDTTTSTTTSTTSSTTTTTTTTAPKVQDLKKDDDKSMTLSYTNDPLVASGKVADVSTSRAGLTGSSFLLVVL